MHTLPPDGPTSSAAPTATAARLHERASSPLRPGPVLLASHGTARDGTALRIASLLSHRLHVPLEVVTVLEPLPIYTGGDMGALPMGYEEGRLAEREAAVRQEVAALLPTPGDWKLHVRFGSIARAIAEVGRERSASLIVIGAAPHRRLRHTIAGERAGQVLRAADCPVLSVAPGGRADLPTHAVVAVDFGAPSIRAAQAALLLLADCGTLTLLHVFPAVDLDRVGFGDRAHHQEASAADAFARLRAELEPIAPAGVTIELRTAVGEIVERILSVAEEVGASLLAVGTHGPNILERIFVGSTATGIVHGAACSVLACPPPSASAALRLALEMQRGVVSHDPEEWPTLLEELSARSANRRVRLEVDDPTLGAQVQGEGLRFMGAAYDTHDRRVEIMLGDGVGVSSHLTRSLGGVDAVSVSADGTGRDAALDVRQGQAHTLVIFAD